MARDILGGQSDEFGNPNDDLAVLGTRISAAESANEELWLATYFKDPTGSGGGVVVDDDMVGAGDYQSLVCSRSVYALAGMTLQVTLNHNSNVTGRVLQGSFVQLTG